MNRHVCKHLQKRLRDFWYWYWCGNTVREAWRMSDRTL